MSEIVLSATSTGVRFGLLGDPGPRPAPVFFIFAAAIVDSLGRTPYSQAGLHLLQHGFLCASLDLPCHGQDHRGGEPEGLRGWRARLEKDEDFVSSFTHQVSRVLDHLIQQGHADADKVAVCGTSRGGFMAGHVAAADPRFRCAALFSPVTELLALSEFAGLENHPLIHSLSLSSQAQELADRSLWLSIGHSDQRVGTDRAIAFSRQVVAANSRADFSLHVLPAEGHSIPAHAHEEAAAWVLSRL